ncbi:Retinoic acid induced 16-like protein-domain-containing protein [Dimargaris cristalligena]|uniref:Retinoic acid induced 16-like protein-domain-containing protein n=1 Tax=Dimargaris cristalligena TaxID=215637 RepID=A0A4Q0A127_9FUNG|nr:Retinoic acid induced 16-like protein-domain-containing protein [Dimargaris cristalligena]|eukprot:RKP39448.1 Retinoic acid induced 16-like protein-domain-containing protein [Dimargaris cristalligena]
MDYIARLTKKLGTPKKAKPTSAMQLAKFEKAWNYCHKTYFLQDKRVDAKVSHTIIPQNLKIMVDILVEEEHQPEAGDNYTGICLEFFLRNNVLASLVNLSEADCPSGLLGEVIRTISSLVELLDMRFLVHKNVHTPLLNLLRSSVSNPQHSVKYQDDLVDLTYLLCSKIHEFPEILHIFFLDRSWLQPNHTYSDRGTPSPVSTTESTLANPTREVLSTTPPSRSIPSPLLTSRSPGAASVLSPGPRDKEYEFLLFTYLLQFVHKEGKTGDFARTGLSFLIELTDDKELSHFILHSSDLCTILSASMGALYSQLPRRLLVTFEENLSSPTSDGAPLPGSLIGTVPTVATAAALSAATSVDMPGGEGSPTGAPRDPTTLAGRSSVSEEPPVDTNLTDAMESSTSPEFHEVMVSFLKLAEFYQEILYRCPNPTVHRGLALSFQTHFLETVLYPSIMESSDTDGTAVAVMSYIELLLVTLKPGELVDTIMRFLLGSDDPDDDAPLYHYLPEVSHPNSPLHATIPPKTPTVAFNLKDLICTNLQSTSRPTIIAALKLWTTILTHHCLYTNQLMDTLPPLSQRDPSSTPWSSLPSHGLSPIQRHRRDMEAYSYLLGLIDGTGTATPVFGYGSYLTDTEAAWTTHQDYHSAADNVIQLGRANTFLSNTNNEDPNNPNVNGLGAGSRPPMSRKYSRQLGTPLPPSQPPLGIFGFGTGQVASACCSPYRLNQADPLILALFNLLAQFFSHSVDINLALTGVVAALASCGYRELDGLFVFDMPPTASNSGTATLTGTAGATSGSLPKLVGVPGAGPAGKDTNWATRPGLTAQPSIFALLHSLAQRVTEFREGMTDFEERLVRTRGTLLLSSPYPGEDPTASGDVVPTTPTPTSLLAWLDKSPIKSPRGPGAMGSNPNLLSPRMDPLKSPTPTAVSGMASSTSQLGGGGSLRRSSVSSSTSSMRPGLPYHSDLGTGPTAKDPLNRVLDQSKKTKVVYSSLCENVLILEEFIKELISIVQVRRTNHNKCESPFP